MEQLDKTTKEKPDKISYPTPSIKELDKSEVTVRLIGLVLDMSESDQRKMLKELEEKHTREKKARTKEMDTQYEEMRIHPRKTTLIVADCSSYDKCFTHFIQDISNGGVFIETTAPFHIGQELKMNFSLPQVEIPVSIGGKVVRVNSRGIGVKFIGGDIHKLDIN